MRLPTTPSPTVLSELDEHGVLLDWLRGQMSRPEELALDFVVRLNTTIHDSITYQARDQGAAQDPAHTVPHREPQGLDRHRQLAFVLHQEHVGPNHRARQR